MSLKDGCYLVSFHPSGVDSSKTPPACVGTWRVVDASTKIRVSGDLYRLSENGRKLIQLEGGKAVVAKGGTGVPVFPLSDYAYYLDVLAVTSGSAGEPVLELQAHKFDPATRRLTPGGLCQLVLQPDSSGTGFTGTLTSAGEERGQLSLRWISKSLRSAALRLFLMQPNAQDPIRKPKARKPVPKLKAGQGQGDEANGREDEKDWKILFGKIGWNLAVSTETPRHVEIPKEDQPWAPYDLGTAALQLRESVDPNTSWVYDLLCVSRFENDQYLGIMFDTEATDLNERPRESAAVAALQPILVDGKPQLAQDAYEGRLYYRAALHELGHAMNLPHNLRGRSLMNITEYLLDRPCLPEDGKPDTRKPGFAVTFEPGWYFDPVDTEWLQHGPDIALRPGGISRHAVRWQRGNQSQVATVSLREVKPLSLSVQPVEGAFPLGAPIRLNYTLTNYGLPLKVPANLSLRGGHLSGRVLGPDREARYFRSAFRCCDSVDHEQQLQELGAEPRQEGMTLLRGIDGPLFPQPGSYQVEVEIRWDDDGQTNRVVGRTSVIVDKADPKTDPKQTLAAELVLNRPVLMPALVQGYLSKEGAIALSHALNSPTLAPHYLATALKCNLVGTRRGQDWDDLFTKAWVSAAEGAPADTTSSNNSTPRKPRTRPSPAAVTTGAPTPTVPTPAVGVFNSSFVHSPIVHTARERDLLEADPDKHTVYNGALTAGANAWLNKLRMITSTPAIVSASQIAPPSPAPLARKRGSSLSVKPAKR